MSLKFGLLCLLPCSLLYQALVLFCFVFERGLFGLVLLNFFTYFCSLCIIQMYHINQIASYFVFYLHFLVCLFFLNKKLINWTENMKLMASLFTGFQLKYQDRLKHPTVFRYVLTLISICQFSKFCKISCTCLEGSLDYPGFI